MLRQGFASVLVVVLAILLSAGTVTYFYAEHASNAEDGIEHRETGLVDKTGKKSANIPDGTIQLELSALELQLERALQSGGIHPDRYSDIEGELTALESGGADTSIARELLSRLSVGGETQKAATVRTGEIEPAPRREASVKITEVPKTTVPAEVTPPAKEMTSSAAVTWGYSREEGKWKPSQDPPECPALVFPAPVDLSKASSILYPGQTRGPSITDYKAHGGFRFDNQTSNAIEVRAPFDGYVWRGNGHYVDGGHVQYGFDIVHECGIMHRFGHLNELSPQFQKLAERLPAATLGDSRTTDLVPFEFVKKGELIAIKIGVPGNPGMDWGVYDLRVGNASSKDLAYRELHAFQWWYDYHGLCWLEYLPLTEQSLARALPGGDGKMGKQSDYCK